MYAGIVDPVGTLFNPAYSVSHIIAHKAYSSLSHRNDLALMKLTKALDITGACGTFTYMGQLKHLPIEQQSNTLFLVASFQVYRTNLNLHLTKNQSNQGCS